MIITSLTNQEIKFLTKLKQKKFRDQEKLFLVEGEHLIEEALKKKLIIKIIVTEQNKSIYPNIDSKLIVTKEIMKKLSSLETPPNIIGLCKMQEEQEVGNKILILDNIQDPGNLGTIIRSAVAFKIDTIILSPNTVDIYNSKVIRSSQGMLFHISIIRKDLTLELEKIKQRNIAIYTTDVKNGIDIKEINQNMKYALIVGNEGQGVSPAIAKYADKKIYIKTNPVVESLNVGVATSILLYELADF